MLVAYRNSQVTQDTAEALRKLELAGANVGGFRIQYGGVPHNLFSWDGVTKEAGPTALPSALSMRPTGREVYLSIKKTDDPMQDLALLWGLAVPLGFMPWNRYPVPGKAQEVFHYMGPLAPIVDFLHGEGRGEAAWPSLCAAAQCLAGTWEGTKVVERTVQAHLYRLGLPCGAIDGVIGPRTLGGLKALGLSDMPLVKVREAIALKELPEVKQQGEDRISYFTIRGASVEGFSSGSVKLIRTQAGYTVTSKGSGQAIFVFGD